MVPWLHRLGISSKVNVNICHMNKEDSGFELYKVQDVVMIKKVKHILRHLQEGSRIRSYMISNII